MRADGRPCAGDACEMNDDHSDPIDYILSICFAFWLGVIGGLMMSLAFR
jgi:hypothetical protein